MDGLRRALDWTFRDRRTGALTIGQWPNAPLWLFLGLGALRGVWAPEDPTNAALRIGAGLALAWWAADEVARGANPWRRILGSSVLAWLIVSVARTLAMASVDG